MDPVVTTVLADMVGKGHAQVMDKLAALATPIASMSQRVADLEKANQVLADRAGTLEAQMRFVTDCMNEDRRRMSTLEDTIEQLQRGAPQPKKKRTSK